MHDVDLQNFQFQWTTDQDLTDAVSACGVTDLLEIKFNENRANGQSKGCVDFISSLVVNAGWNEK
jgi:hypothetical protein